jgi:hypothetical protein
MLPYIVTAILLVLVNFGQGIDFTLSKLHDHWASRTLTRRRHVFRLEIKQELKKTSHFPIPLQICSRWASVTTVLKYELHISLEEQGLLESPSAMWRSQQQGVIKCRKQRDLHIEIDKSRTTTLPGQTSFTIANCNWTMTTVTNVNMNETCRPNISQEVKIMRKSKNICG